MKIHPDCCDRTIIVYFDDTSDPNNPGWVTRCSEHDKDGHGIPGRCTMDAQIDAQSLAEAIAEAADHWGCEESEVALYDGPT